MEEQRSMSKNAPGKDTCLEVAWDGEVAQGKVKRRRDEGDEPRGVESTRLEETQDALMELHG